MKSLKSILPYLLLNIIVSAVTTLAILWWWGRTQPIKTPASTPLPAATSATTPAANVPAAAVGPSAVPATGQPSAAGQPVIEIENIFGVGDTNTEVVRLKRLGDTDLTMTGWQLKDEQNHVFTFPELVLNKGGAVEIYTRSGPNSVIELHWGLDQPVWSTGETARLFDPQGAQQAEFKIP
jgi:hypothetical protein